MNRANLSAQTEPAAIWATQLIVFDKALTPTQNVVITQGRRALQALIRRIDRLYELVHEPPHIMDSYAHPEIPQVLTEICAHQGVASLILFNNSPRDRNESARSYQLRMQRHQYVKDACDSLSVERGILTSRTLRNQLIHIDTHIEKAMRTPKTGWTIDSAMAYRDQYNAPDGIRIGFFRTFIVSEEVLLHLSHEISIKDLRSEATNVLFALFAEPLTPPPQPPVHSRQAAQPLPSQTGA